MTTVQDLRLVTGNRDRYEGMILARPAVKRDIAYFQQNIGRITSAEELLKDDRLYRFVMEAFDLGSQTYAKGLIRKVLDEGVADPSSTANRMNDSKFKELATVLGFAENDGANLKEPVVVQAIIDRYVDVKLEVDTEERNPAARLALYFQRRAPGITNWYQVLADRALQKVVFTTLGLPEQTALQNLDRVKERLEKSLDIKDFQNPDKLRSFLDRFSAMYDLQNGTPTAAAAATTAGIGPLSRSGRASIIAIDPTVMLSLLKFPRF